MVMGGSWPRTTGTTPRTRLRIITRWRTRTTRRSTRTTPRITRRAISITQRTITPFITLRPAITLLTITTRFISRVWQGATAFCLIVAGVALWSVPAALLVAGVLLLADRIT
jgi:hypothetical protein